MSSIFYSIYHDILLMKLSHSLQIFAQIFHTDNLDLLKIKLDFFLFLI